MHECRTLSQRTARLVSCYFIVRMLRRSVYWATLNCLRHVLLYDKICCFLSSIKRLLINRLKACNKHWVTKSLYWLWCAKDREESEQYEVDETKKGTDSTGKVMHISKSGWWFVMRKIRVVELGWHMRSGFYLKTEQRSGYVGSQVSGCENFTGEWQKMVISDRRR